MMFLMDGWGELSSDSQAIRSDVTLALDDFPCRAFAWNVIARLWRIIPTERVMIMRRLLWAAAVCWSIAVSAFNVPAVRANENWVEQDETEALTQDLGPESANRFSRSRYLRAETVMLGFWQAAADQSIVIRTLDENDDYPGPTLLTAHDVTLGLQAGPQITFGVVDEFGDGWETRYFSLLGGRKQAVATGVNNVALPGDLGLASIDFFGVEQIGVDATGDLHSIELNRCRDWGGFTFLAGIRYLRLYDRMTFTSDDTETDTFAVYDLKTANNLFGAQLGLRHGADIGRFHWQVDAKAGLYGNAATHSQVVVDFPNPDPPFFLREWCPRSRGGAAFIGELEFGLSYAITDNWSARAGYRMLWVEGVGLPANQLNFNDVASSEIGLSIAGGILMHGASVGLELHW
jgi:hypothetical protein